MYNVQIDIIHAYIPMNIFANRKKNNIVYLVSDTKFQWHFIAKHSVGGKAKTVPLACMSKIVKKYWNFICAL